MERFTITKTRRWGNVDTQISHIYSANRNEAKKDDVIRLANEMISDENFIISDKLFQNNYLKLSIGKKRHIKIEKD